MAGSRPGNLSRWFHIAKMGRAARAPLDSQELPDAKTASTGRVQKVDRNPGRSVTARGDARCTPRSSDDRSGSAVNIGLP